MNTELLIDDSEFKTPIYVEEVEKQEHDYGNTQIHVPDHSSAAATLNAARAQISDDDLMATGKDVDPNHITVRYGLVNDDLDQLRSFIASQDPFEAYVWQVELFPASEHSDGAVPVVAQIISPELRAIEAEIGNYADFKEKNFPVYKPHCTLAYVKPEAAAQYADLFLHGSFLVQGITISHQSGVQETIPFGHSQLIVKWDEAKHTRDKEGQFTEQATTVHGPGSSVQLPGRYDRTKLPPKSFAITTEHGYILASQSSSDPGYYWVNHIRVSDKHQGKGEGSALFRAAAAEAKRQGFIGLMRGDIPDRPASDAAQAVWAKLKNTSTYTDAKGFVHHVLKFDENKHPRDAKGQFEESYHGTTISTIEGIKAHGLLTSKNTDLRNRVQSVYVTTDEDRAHYYGLYHGAERQPSGFYEGDYAIVKAEIPVEHWEKHAIEDERDDEGVGTSFRFEQDIPVEWIKSIQTVSSDGRLKKIEHFDGTEWKTTYESKKAQDNVRVVYIPVRIPVQSVAKFDEAKHPRDKEGQFTESGVPPEPGTTPIPPGKVRVYHYTDNLDAVEKEGLSVGKARGNTYGEPNVIWFSTEKPGDFKEYVEVFLDPEEIGIGAPQMVVKRPEGWKNAETPEEKQEALDDYNKGNHNLTALIREVPPERFVTTHRPWHDHYRYLVNDARAGAAALAGEYDWALAENNEYAPAIRLFKEKHAKKWDPDQPRDKEGQFTKDGGSTFTHMTDAEVEAWSKSLDAAPQTHAQKVQEYLGGQCWPFAVALQRLNGGEIHVLEDKHEPDDPPLHAVVKRTDGTLMDASGVVTLRELKKRYQLSSRAKLRPATEKQIDEIDPLKPEEIEAARQFILANKWEEAQHPRDKEGQFTRGWHLTADPHFVPDPTFRPQLNSLAGDLIENPPAGMFVGDPRYWMHAHGYERPYVAEIEGLVTNPSGTVMHKGHEQFMQAPMRTVRVLPLDEYAREVYGEEGWVESHFSSSSRPRKMPKGYVGRPVSEMTAEEVSDWERKFAKYFSRPDGPHPNESLAQKKDPLSGRYVTPFVSFDKQGDEQLRMIASLNSSRLATWGFTAEAEVLGMARYRLTAVLDGRTSKFCRLVDGKIFEVTDARRKVIEVLDVQDPEDLRVVQPWPKQTKQALAEFAQMTPAELTERGLHIPPYHPHCRTILRAIQTSIGAAKEMVPTTPVGVEAFQKVTAADLKELGIEATQENVDQWNMHIGMSPVELLSKLSGMPPQEVMTKGKGVGSNPIAFDPSGNIGFNVRGATPQGVEFKLRALLDPFTGTYYLTQADLLAGNPKAELAYMKNLFKSLIDMGLKGKATSVAVGVEGNAAYYARLGFLPDELEWDSLRKFAIDQVGGPLAEMLASLAPADRLLVEHLLQDKSVGALSALVELPFTYKGKRIGEWLFGDATGTWALDLTDDMMVAQAKAYLE